MFKLGLIINPLAGLGGSVALKGSDNMAEQALSMGAVAKAGLRTSTALSVLEDLKPQIQVFTCANEMGASVLEVMDWSHKVVYEPAGHTSADDTKNAALKLKELGMDLIVFAGGDGTARDVCSVIEDACPVLGIPAGVKIHSGVYGITPSASGEVIRLLVTGQLVDLRTQDVRDIDEDAFRNNQVKAKLYGEMLVPQAGQFVQSVKQGGIEQEELVLDDLAAYLTSELEPDVLYLVGSGKTTQHFMEYLHLPNTLLGVDAMVNEHVIAQDLNEQSILELLSQYSQAKIIVSVIGGQGHVFGRGNQQLSSDVIKKVGRENLMILSTKTKLSHLEGRPLIADTSDVELDKALAGHIEVITGYQDKVLYPIQ
ncbi:ATP-NAD kinase family protein [Oceaniserpentilla sp. 4NH20-0058]|uniref:ATP-NAD kinase family protein n=1 Tax=Oceaniserpentilla sp. 4NH20-0058 TaxID=3127660 RepID=UPI00310C624D